jgi:methyl coenzyme M reductase beta subunit
MAIKPSKTQNPLLVSTAFPAWLRADKACTEKATTLGKAIAASFQAGTLEADLNPYLAKLNNDVKADGTDAQIEAYGIANKLKSMVYYQTGEQRTMKKVRGGKGFEISIPKARAESAPSYAAYIKLLGKVQEVIAAMPKDMRATLKSEATETLPEMLEHAEALALAKLGVSPKAEVVEFEIVEIVIDDELEAVSLDDDIREAINA